MRAPYRHQILRWLPVLFLSVLAGCGSAPDKNDDHPHDDEALNLTGWSASFEVYAEHPALWAGRSAGYVFLVTDMTDGSPRSSGALTLRGENRSGDPATVITEAPVSLGKYAAVLTLPVAGSWSLSLEIDDQTVQLGSVQVHPDRESALHAKAPAPPTGILLHKEQQWRLGVRSMAVTYDTFKHVVRIPATVVAPPDRRAVVSSPLDGRLGLAPGGVLPLPGDSITTDDCLAVIHPLFSGALADAATAEAEVVRAATSAVLAEAELARARILAADGATSARRLQEASAAAEHAAAQLEAAERVRDAYRTTGLDTTKGGSVQLSAPLDGIITEVHASLGEHVPAGGAVFTILDPSVVWLRGRVPESEMLLLGDSPTASYRLPGVSNVLHSLRGADSLVYLSHEVDTATRTAPIIFRYVNDAGLRVGMAMELVVQTRREERGLVIPREALVDEDGEMIIFVHLNAETFEKRHVDIGGDDGTRVVILSGLLAGERIVVTSPYSILLAQTSTSIPAHGH